MAASTANSPAPAAARTASPDVGLVDRHRGGVHGGPGHLRAHQHVGTQVLHGLERPDGLAELLSLLGIPDGQVHGGGGQTDEERAPEDRRVSPPRRGVIGAAHRVARRQTVDAPQRGEGVERTVHGHGVEGGGVDHGQAVLAHHHQRAQRTEMLR